MEEKPKRVPLIGPGTVQLRLTPWERHDLVMAVQDRVETVCMWPDGELRSASLYRLRNLLERLTQ